MSAQRAGRAALARRWQSAWSKDGCMGAEPSPALPRAALHATWTSLRGGLTHQARADGGKGLHSAAFPPWISFQAILQEAWKMHLLISTACPLGLLHPLNSPKVYYCSRYLQTPGRRNRTSHLCWLFILFSNYRTNLLNFHLI